MVQRFGPLMNPGGAVISLTYNASNRIIPGYGGGMSSAKAVSRGPACMCAACVHAYGQVCVCGWGGGGGGEERLWLRHATGQGEGQACCMRGWRVFVGGWVGG